MEYFSTKSYKNKFDVVVGNPPYVRARIIDLNVKELLDKWEVVTGNVDLYIPFYQWEWNCWSLAECLGIFLQILFLQSVNGRGLRNYIRNKKVSARIINFKGEQRFQGITSYTCVVLLGMDGNSTIEYAISKGDLLDEYQYTSYNISAYADNQTWRFGNQDIDKLII